MKENKNNSQNQNEYLSEDSLDSVSGGAATDVGVGEQGRPDGSRRLIGGPDGCYHGPGSSNKLDGSQRLIGGPDGCYHGPGSSNQPDGSRRLIGGPDGCYHGPGSS